MRHRLLISLSIIILLLTACSAAAGRPAGTAAHLFKDQLQEDLTVPAFTDSGLSMAVKDFTYDSKPITDLEPVDNCFGFPIELVSDLRYRMQQGDADVCIKYLYQLNEQDYQITNDEFFSLLDKTDEEVKDLFDENEADYICYQCDTDGDGIDELIAFEKDRRGTLSYVYMLVKGEKGYLYFSSNYIDNVRFFSLFQYDNAFYYAASCNDNFTGTVNLQMFMLNRNIFKFANITDSICFNRIFDISEPYLLYCNEIYPDISPVEVYLGDVLYDVIHANRANETFHGEEWGFQIDDIVYVEDETENQVRDWGSTMYLMDINNDGKDELFSKSLTDDQQPHIHTVKWYADDGKQCPASVEIWKDDHYRLADMWFKNINGKVVTFTLYQELQSGRNYLIDARIQDHDETIILMDYMVVLEPANIKVTEFGIGTDVPIYKSLLYQDPELYSAIPYNLQEMAEVLLLKVQGAEVDIEAIPETFQWQKIYDNQADYKPAVTDYLESIKTELMDLSCQAKDEAIYLGDEDPEIDPDKFLRLGSVISPYQSYYKIDFNNDQKDEFITKEKNYNNIYTGIYQFTDRGIISLEYDETVGDTWGKPIQLWFKEIDGRVFTFRLFYNEDTYYVLNVSLIEDTNITQVQTYLIVPKMEGKIAL